jgi:hypothetical protein
MTPLPCSHIDHDALTLGHPHCELPDPKTRRSTWRHYENFATGASAILGGAKLESLLQEPHQPTVSQSRHCEFHTHEYLCNATEFRKFSPQSTGKPVQNATLGARRQTRALVYRRSCNAPGVELSGRRAARQLSTELPREVVTVSLSCAPRSALRAMEIGRHLGSHPPPHSDVGRYAAHDRACEFCVRFDAVLRLPEEVRADGARCREPGESDQGQAEFGAVAHGVSPSVQCVCVGVRSSCPECCSSESRKHGQSTDSFVRALTKLSAEISGRSPRSYGPSRLRHISPPSQRPTSAQPHAGSRVNSSRLTASSKPSCTRRSLATDFAQPIALASLGRIENGEAAAHKGGQHVAPTTLSTCERDMRTYGPRNVGHLDLTAKAAPSRGGECSPDLDSVHTAGTRVRVGQRYRARRLQRELLAPRLCRESGGVTPTAQMTQVIGRKRAEVQGSAPITEGVWKAPHQFSSGGRFGTLASASILIARSSARMIRVAHAARSLFRSESRGLGRSAIAKAWTDPASRVVVAPSAGGYETGIPAAAECAIALRSDSRPWISATSRGARNPRTLITGSGGRLAIQGRAVA